jgi:hypothetical protein
MRTRKRQDPHELILAGRAAEAGEGGSLTAHAAGCRECAETLRTDEVLKDHFGGQLEPVHPAFIRATCEKAFASHETRAPLWWVSVPLSWRFGLAALLVLAAVGGFSLGRGGAQPAAQVSEHRLAPLLDAPELIAMKAEGPSSCTGGGR